MGVWFDAENRVLFNQVNITPRRLFFAPGSGFVDMVIEALGGTSFVLDVA